MNRLIDIIIEERKILRNELIQLKNCQLRYFTLSVTATGVLLGLGIQLGSGKSSGLFFLAPLLIVLPCWWIFFDKATTITRMVGYIRVLEEVLRTMANGGSKYQYMGWEVALGLYREAREKARIKRHFLHKIWLRTVTVLKGFKAVVLFTTSHRYWSINWYTYFVITMVCWALSNGLLLSEAVT